MQGWRSIKGMVSHHQLGAMALRGTFMGSLPLKMRMYAAAHQKARHMAMQRYASTLQAAKVIVSETTAPKEKQPLDSLVFGHAFSDHMLMCEWDSETGWHAPRIQPYQPLVLDPSCVVFHYGLECFEGMKAYKRKEDGKVMLFRPDKNMERLQKSGSRLCLPRFDEGELLTLIKKLVALDSSWVPAERGYSLYVRPTFIGTQPTLGVGPTNRAMLFVICSPVGPYYKTGFSAVQLYADEQRVRAWPGGTGHYKIGGNYGPCIQAQLEAGKLGYQQNLWLFGDQHEVTEVGTMNCFLYWKNEEGVRELITPRLDGTILPGVTRDSILTLAKEWGLNAREGPFNMKQVVNAIKEGRVLEMFGAGTACIVSPIRGIHYMGTDYTIPLDPHDPDAQAGPLARKLFNTILNIQYGDEPHHPWCIEV